jgi:hypothetical protein
VKRIIFGYYYIVVLHTCLAVSSLISLLLGPQVSISTHLKDSDLNVVHQAQESLKKTYFLLSKQIIYFHSGMSCVQSGTSDQQSIEIGNKVASTNLERPSLIQQFLRKT